VEVLLDVGGSVGLERGGLRLALDEGRYTEKVVSDEWLATRLGVDSVPTMFVTREGASLEEAEKVTGAQPHGGRIEAAVEKALGQR
jgi:predicted DsbA family dithiol-disulfide isomerase